MNKDSIWGGFVVDVKGAGHAEGLNTEGRSVEQIAADAADVAGRQTASVPSR